MTALASPLLWTVGWTLIHVTWVATTLWILAVVLEARSTRWPPSRRYRSAFALLVATLAALALTLYAVSQGQSSAGQLASVLDGGSPTTRIRIHHATGAGSGAGVVGAVRSTLAALWIAGALLAWARTISGVLRTARVVRGARLVTDPAVRDRLESLARGLDIRRRVRLAASIRVSSPFQVGLFRPTILVPSSLLESARDLDFVLIHELAHVQRLDALDVLLQRLVECALFWHPLTQFLSRWLNVEREHCCDRTVLAETAAPRAYTHTLLRLARPDRGHDVALAMSRKPLVDRIASILNQERRPMKKSKSSYSIALGVALASCVAISLRAQDPRPRAELPAARTEAVGTAPQGVVLRVDAERRVLTVRFAEGSGVRAGQRFNVYSAAAFKATAVAVGAKGRLVTLELDRVAKGQVVCAGDRCAARQRVH